MGVQHWLQSHGKEPGRYGGSPACRKVPTGWDGAPAQGMKDSGMTYVVNRHTQCSSMGSGIAGELAEPCGEAGRYGATPACRTEPTGLDGPLVYLVHQHMWWDIPEYSILDAGA